MVNTLAHPRLSRDKPDYSCRIFLDILCIVVICTVFSPVLLSHFPVRSAGEVSHHRRSFSQFSSRLSRAPHYSLLPPCPQACVSLGAGRAGLGARPSGSLASSSQAQREKVDMRSHRGAAGKVYIYVQAIFCFN